MSAAWRGFAGLVAVFLLVYFVSDLDRKIEEEKALLSKDPRLEAERAFREKEFLFYESWHRQFDEEGNPIGFWVLPGKKEIPDSILKEYPVRMKLENSKNLNLSEDHTRYTKKARRWATRYNIHLSKLLTDLGSNQPE